MLDLKTGVADQVETPATSPGYATEERFAASMSGDGSTVVVTIHSYLKQYVDGDMNRVEDVFGWEAPPAG